MYQRKLIVQPPWAAVQDVLRLKSYGGKTCSPDVMESVVPLTGYETGDLRRRRREVSATCAGVPPLASLGKASADRAAGPNAGADACRAG